MHKYRVDLSYDGTDYCGFQRQLRQKSVQQTIEEALRVMLQNPDINVVGCGRTDTGVHAKHYVLHFETLKQIDCEIILYKANRYLPNNISFQQIESTTDDFHARYSARKRTYRYYFHFEKNPFKDKFSLYLPNSLNILKMKESLKYFLGKQDFTSFSKLHTTVKSNVCNITHLEIVEYGKNEYYFEISADRFLRNMVRAITGTLVDIGMEKYEPETIKEIISKKDRRVAGKSVEAKGLFLWDVRY